MGLSQGDEYISCIETLYACILDCFAERHNSTLRRWLDQAAPAAAASQPASQPEFALPSPEAAKEVRGFFVVVGEPRLCEKR